MQLPIKNRLQRMDDYDFEYFVADLWERMGWECEVSQASVDAGIDVVATKSNPYPQKELIQAKRYGPNTTVGGPDIQQYASLKQQQSGVDSVVVVTTNSFTRAAENRAEDLNVKLVDGDGLVSMVNDLRAESILEEYNITSPEGPHSQSTAGSARIHGREATSEAKAGGFLRRIVGSRDWHRVLLKSSGLAFVFLIVGSALSGTGIGVLEVIGNVAVLAWFLSVVAIAGSLYLDIRYVRRHSSWNPTAWKYLVGLVVFFVTLPVYFYRRRSELGVWR